MPPRPPITPLTLPRRVRTVLVFGGSFDPPHFYHTMAPLTVAKRLYGPGGWVLYVPAAASPLKPNGPHASDEHRLAMLRLGLDVPGPRSIWTDEIDRARWLRERGVETPSYTIDTLRRLRRLLPERIELRLLIGSDQAAAFHRWKDARKVVALAEPLVLAREPIVTASSLFSSLDKDFWTLAERRAWCTRLAPNHPMEKSSTQTRDAIPGAPKDPANWNRRPGLAGIITPVAEYIISRNLYGFRRGGERVPVVPAIPAGDRPGALRRLERSFAIALLEAGASLLRDRPTKKKPPARAEGR